MSETRVAYPADVPADLLDYCRSHRLNRVVVLADSNTFPILGSKIASTLEQGGCTTSTVILGGRALVSDERAIVSVLIDAEVESDAIIAVGAGTITDIARFVSHRTGKRFVSVPTAPSVDGYTSSGAPLVFQGFKRTIRCHAPEAVCVSLPVLTNAPKEMIAAGFGDVLGKITALADWELSHVLVGNRFDRAIADDTRRVYENTVAQASAIAARTPEAIQQLFEALSLTGASIRAFGSSEPASGSEHMISHFLEMGRLRRSEPEILHGLKVGLGTLIAAQWYQQLRSLTREEVRELSVSVPDFEHDAAEIRSSLGEAGEYLLESNSLLSTMSLHTVRSIHATLLRNWDEIQRIAESVPAPAEIAALLSTVGAPTGRRALGLSHQEVAQAARLSHYVRSRFTVKTLLFVLGLSAASDDLP